MSIGQALLKMCNDAAKKYWLKRRGDCPDYDTDDHLVFVYGSLKRGFYNNDVLRDSEFVTTTKTTRAKYNMLSVNGFFPGICHQGQYHISGEVYRVSGDVLWAMDIIEGNGDFYQRETVSVEGVDGLVWMYFLMSRDVPTDPTCHMVWTDGTTQTWIDPPDSEVILEEDS